MPQSPIQDLVGKPVAPLNFKIIWYQQDPGQGFHGIELADQSRAVTGCFANYAKNDFRLRHGLLDVLSKILHEEV